VRQVLGAIAQFEKASAVAKTGGSSQAQACLAKAAIAALWRFSLSLSGPTFAALEVRRYATAVLISLAIYPFPLNCESNAFGAPMPHQTDYSARGLSCQDGSTLYRP